jgi:cobalt-zinc-cadmium efflux system outer membrane protein
LNRGLAIFGIVLLAGCARFDPRPIAPAETAAKIDARSLAAPEFRKFLEKNLDRHFDDWPLKSWDFETLNLAALYYHPSLDVARAQWDIALGGDKTAAARPNPTLTATPGYDFTATSIGVNPWIPGVVFDVPFETMGKRGYRKARAAHLTESARLNIAIAAWQVRSNLRNTLIDLASARQREQMLDRQISIHGQIIGSLEKRLQAGAISSSELLPMQLALAKTRLDLADARRQAADARVRVADAIGVPVKALERLDLAYDLSMRHATAAELMSVEVRDAALRNRADVLGALADYAASQSALQLEIAKQYPDVHLGPGYQFNNGDHQFTLAISAELPILNQNQGPIAEARARRTEAAAKFIAVQAKAITEIDRAVAAFRVTTDNLSGLEALAAAQRKQNDAVVAQQKAGAADQLDLLNSRLELAASELVQLDGRTKLQQAFAALEDAVQRPVDLPKAELFERPPAQAMKEKQP